MTMIETLRSRTPPPETLRALIAEGPSAKAVMQLLPGFGLTALKVDRVHFPGTKPVQVQIGVSDDDGHSRTLIGEWVGADASRLARTELTRLTKPRRGQVVNSDNTAVSADPAHGLVLRRQGFDAKLPGLRLLHDTDWASARLAAMGCDPAVSVSLVAHRLGKRAVLRVSGPDGTRYARLRPITSSSGQAAFDRHLALWKALDGEPSLSIPRPLGFDADMGLALFDALPGKPPEFQGLNGFRATKAVMQAMAAMQALPVDAPAHQPDDELAILQAWHIRTTNVFPDLAVLLQAPLARLQDDMTALRAIPPVLCHRDLHEGQILLNRRRAGFLDFDTLRLGDPALDAGNLQAHLLLATLRDRLPRRAFVTAIDTALPHLSLHRIAVWRRAALLRLAMIYAFSAEPREVILGLIGEAA
ncbi:MAG: aminoglycoside phosphotransferase family protein [Paracoccaceae bacterium]